MMKIDTGQSADQGRDGVFAAVAIVVLFALTVGIAPSLARALEVAVNVASGSAAAITHGLDEERPYPRDIEEEQPEPPLAGAVRAAGPMSA